ncbi:MAG: hypothetical protein HQM02_03120 [Magnetococcales bacterium]|nr:hypothetical protein [Magnetococcales bacterium]
MSIQRNLSGLAGLLAWGMIGGGVLADTPKESSPHTVTANLGVVSNYIFRGLTQTWDQPAVQGGVDYSHAFGWYAGAWASSISDRQFANGFAEADLYGGYNGKFTDDWTWTLGMIGYLYPGANYDQVKPAGTYRDQGYHTFELNAGLGYQWVSLKVSVALTDYFGANVKTGYTGDSQGSTYVDVTANVPLPASIFTRDVTLPLHVGRTNYTNKLAAATINGGTNPDYTDYKIGLTKAFDGGWTLGAAYVYADNKAVYNGVASAKDPANTRNLGGGNVLVSLTKTF